jgi:D-beta-D-heptose 7-phosphate kinase/D-beta-D-heptose 1-phosphate adenosyltransferase
VVGHELVEADGGEVILIDLVPGHSTTRIVQRSGGATPDGTRRKEPAKS